MTMKKRFRTIIALLFTALVVFILFNVNALHNEIRENQYNRLVNELGKVTVEFSTWINTKIEMLNTSKDIVNNFTYDEIAGYNTDNPYLNVNKDDPDVTEVYIGFEDGSFITGSDWIPPEDYDPRTRVWYIEAVKEDKTIISDIYIDRDTGNRTITISSPLYLEEEFVGVISTDVFLIDIDKYLKDQLLEDGIFAYLMDENSTILIHTRASEMIGRKLYDDVGTSEMNAYFSLAISTGEEVEMQFDFDGIDFMGIIHELVGIELYLGVAMEDQSDNLRFTDMDVITIVIDFLLFAFIITLLVMVVRMKKVIDDANDELRLDNERDFLTGIYNRRYFDFILDKLWKESDQETNISLLMMDIDYFKNYNDTYGHVKGDEILKLVTRLIQEQIRKEDILSRYGGEEFTILLDKVSEETALSIAEKIRRAIFDAAIEHRDSPFGRLTISIGAITCRPDRDCDVQHFVSEADEVLYKAKEMGKNVVMVHHK